MSDLQEQPLRIAITEDDVKSVFLTATPGGNLTDHTWKQIADELNAILLKRFAPLFERAAQQEARVRALIEKWRKKATISMEESGRIRRITFGKGGAK